MTYSDGKGYVWHLPVDDDATEPFWVPVDHYEEEQRLHEDGRVYEDGRWQEEAARSGAEAGQEEDVAESGGSSDPPLGERMTHTDGREYAWHLPVDDDATEPFWVPVDHYEEEQRLHEDGRVYEDGRWHADQDAVAEARRLEEIAEENERERQAHAQERDDARQVLRDYAEGRHVPLSVEELRQLPASEEEIALAEERRAELDAERMTQLEDDLRGLIFERRGEGYYVSNRDEWEQLLFHFGWPVDLGNDVMVPAYDLILGTERPEDAAGTCGDFLERGSEWLPPMLDEVFGDDYVMSAIGVESDRFSNHVANVVILPDGSRSVIDVWQGMAHPNEQFIFTEQEWLERWEGEVESRWAPTQHIDPGELGASDEEDRMWSFIDSGNGRERIEEEGLEEGLRYWIEATDDEDIRRERSIVVRNLLDHDTYRSSQYQP